ncbi:MAG TPA: RNA polymerase factor sigma-54 [Fibrobacteraceae bacterium]|jgi:RNA polymerase sigma-54 factor|nr:RNA polymerase factor sigma-54 [Fibrobacteraceae bacterium]HQB64260.1 RNA polymerase factor sigma-54 [Fibrobacteraceae bacterium]
MNLGMQLNQGVRLEQTLSPQMLQSITILQMNTLDLETAIKQETEQNPLLELADTEEKDEADSLVEDYPEDYSDVNSDSDDVETGLIDDPDEKLIDWDKYFEEGFVDADRPLKDLNVPDPEEEEWIRQPTESQSMQDFLKNQLRSWKRPERIVVVVEYLIDCLDEKGYVQSALAQDVSTLQVRSGFKEVEEISPEYLASSNPDILEAEEVLQNKKELEEASFFVREAFHILQSLSPRGIGARNLRECLLIQAYSLPDFSLLAIRILEKHFESLKTLRYGVIAKELDVTTEEVQGAVQELSKLSPHPGVQISNSSIQMIVPDMSVVEEKPGVFKVIVKEAPFRSRLRINQTYRKLLMNSSTSKKDKEYIREKLNAANSFLRSVDNRQSTIELVMNAILKRQMDFFIKGPEYLHPMILQTIADDIQRDPSTVNRVTNGKYVETPYGIYELKQFFTNGLKQDDGSDLSSARILNAIKELIENEDRKKPLSDQALTNALEEKGIRIARRTVAKYREEELKILPARLRKEV